jgi:carboxypeptidase family protein
MWRLHRAGFAGAVVAVFAALVIGVPEAQSAGPGAWTTVEGPDLTASPMTAARGLDGSLFVAFLNVAGNLAVSHVGADGAALGAQTAIATGGTTLNPIVRDPFTGQLRVLYGGFRTPPGETGTWSATAPAAGMPWSAPTRIGSLSSALMVAATAPDGTLYTGQPDPPAVHRGTDPATPDHSFAAVSGQQASLATDGLSGAPFLGWMAPSGSDFHVTVREGSPATGAPAAPALEAPGLDGAPADAAVGQAVPLSGRTGAAGVFTAYLDTDKDQGELLLWRVGDATPRSVAQLGGTISVPALAAAPDGGLWIVWFEDTALTADKIAVRELRPDGTTLGPVTRVSLPPSSGLFPSQIVAVAQADRVDVLASDTDKHIWHTQVLSSPQGGGGDAPGALSGRVTQPDGGPVPAALVEACPQPVGQCPSVYTDADGRYRFDGLRAGGYVVVAWPPRNRRLTVSRRGGVSIVPAGAELAGQDLVMRETTPRPPNVAVFGPGVLNEIGGVPRIVRDKPLVIIVDISDDLADSNKRPAEVESVQLSIFDDGPGTIEPPFSDPPFAGPLRMAPVGDASFCEAFPAACEQFADAPLPPPRVPAGLDLHATRSGRPATAAAGFCPTCTVFGKVVPIDHLKRAKGDRWKACYTIVFQAGGDAFDCWAVWVDPSGYVRTTRGQGLPGARVVLMRSAVQSGPFVQVADGSAEMSPANRKNPDVTDATGHFGWDVVSGFYKVQATHKRCTSPADRRQKLVETGVYEIPPPVTDIDLRMRCPPAPAPARKAKPKLSGKARVGARLTCSKGRWRNKPKRYQYLWLRGRSPLLEQRAPRYRATKADRRKRISCIVYASNAFGTGKAGSKGVRIR